MSIRRADDDAGSVHQAVCTGEVWLLALPAASISNAESCSTTIENLVLNVKCFVTQWDTAVALRFHSSQDGRRRMGF